jgi:Big-like domain-containing protein/calcineurin-like phosphoesterase family protein
MILGPQLPTSRVGVRQPEQLIIYPYREAHLQIMHLHLREASLDLNMCYNAADMNYCLKSFAPLFLALILAIVGCASSGQGGGETPVSGGPTVTSTTPLSGATDAFAVPTVSAIFSAAMDETTITSENFTLLGSGGTAISGTVSYDADSMTATFTPNESLEIGAIHTAKITTAVSDSSGNALGENYSWEFTPDGFFFVVLSDTHVRLPGNPDDDNYDNAGNIANLEAAIDTINANYSNADFVMVTGDLVGCLFSEDPADYGVGVDNPAERYKAMMDELDMPYYSALGNHDYEKGFDTTEGEGISTSNIAAIESVWSKVLGITPYYSFLNEGLRFIILNSNRGDSRNTLCYSATVEAFCTGSFDDVQMEWFESELEIGDPSLLFFHHPVDSDDAFKIWSYVGDSFLVSATDRFYDIAATYNDFISGIFVGHGHKWQSGTLSLSIPVNETAAIGDGFSSADNMNIVSVNPSAVTINVVRNN